MLLYKSYFIAITMSLLHLLGGRNKNIALMFLE